MSYTEQLKHPNWQRKRLQILDASGFECSECGSKDKTLHVHHKRYIKGRKAWEYEDDVFTVLCEDCHLEAHQIKEEFDQIIASLSIGQLHEMSHLVNGFRFAAESFNFGKTEKLNISIDVDREDPWHFIAGIMAFYCQSTLNFDVHKEVPTAHVNLEKLKNRFIALGLL